MLITRLLRVKWPLALLISLLSGLWGSPAQAQVTKGAWTALVQSAAAAVRDDWRGVEARLRRVPSKSRGPETHALQGLARLALGDPGGAGPLLDKALQSRATLAEAHAWAGIASLRRGSPAAAIASFDVAVSLRSDRPEYRLGRGMAAAASGDLDRAVADIVASAEARPNLLEPEFHPDERRGVIRLLSSALERFPTSSRVPTDDIALRLTFQADLHGEAASLASSRDSAVAHEIRGRLALLSGDAVQAAAQLGRAAHKAPASAEARFHLARALHARGKRLRALGALRAAADLAPRDPRIQIALGDLYREGGELSKARLAYEYALSRQVSPRALVGLGRALELSGDLNGARRSYQRALKLAPAGVEILERLGRLQERQPDERIDGDELRRQLAAAVELEQAFERQVERVEENATAHAGLCALIERSPDEAARRLQREKSGGAAARAFALVAAESRLGHRAAAERHARALLRSLPPRRWSQGARPMIVVQQQLGETVLVRAAPLRYIWLEMGASRE